MASISKFLSVTKASFARPNLYTVEIGGGSPLSQEDKIMLNCNTVSIPNLALNYTDEGWRKIPHKRLYGEIMFTFQISEDFAELEYFDKWFRQIGWDQNGHYAYHNDYVRDIIIRNYSTENKIILTTKMFDAFPTTIDMISLGYANNSTTTPLAVKCGYWYHKHEYGDTENTGEPISVASKDLQIGEGMRSGGTSLLDFRGAQFKTVMVFVSEKMELVSKGSVKGLITKESKGIRGFGYDPVFYIPEMMKTFAEMTIEEKNGISHRGIATRNMIKLLQSHRIIPNSQETA